MKDVINSYAKLIVDFAVKVGEGHTVVIDAPVECMEFARAIAALAYQRKAQEVIIDYYDNQYKRMQLINTATDILTDIPEWKIQSKEYFAQKKATMIKISFTDPDLYQDINPDKIGEVNKASSMAFKNYMNMIMGGDCPWVIVEYPSLPWARKVFPNLDDEAALNELWKAVLYAVRLDQPNPVKAWEEHKKNIDERKLFLNSNKFKQLIFRNNLGTNLTVGLPDKHIWVGASSITNDGLEYIPNMPTEEIFTLPHKYQVDGTLVSTMPLNYGGQLIDGFAFEFKEGKIIDYRAKVGKEVLDNIFRVDDGASYLGEVALVPYNSPLSNLNLMFYSTLYDENASCHFALGRAYRDSLDLPSMSAAEMDRVGFNDSLLHIDFMVGSADLDIIGIDYKGNEVKVFEKGNWAVAKSIDN